jgi:putative FmdB family regulatory protein
MPNYDFICGNCGSNETHFFHMEEEHTVDCENCGAPMSKDYAKMIPAYHDVPVDSIDMDITGKPIRFHTKKQLKQIAKDNGCMVE